MPNYKESYQDKLCKVEEAIKLVKDGDYLIVPTAVGEPPALLTSLSEHRREYHDVKICQVLPLRKFDYYDPETVENIRHIAYFIGGVARAGAQEGWTDYVPNYFCEMPRYIEDGLMPVDSIFALASPMDEHGYFSLGLGTSYVMASLKKARTIVLEVNPNAPFSNGNCLVHISQVTALIEDDEPLTQVGLPKIGPVQQAIGKYVADLIDDGSTIQIGFGAIPDAVVTQLTSKHDLGIHSEMFGDGILSLIESGAVNNLNKNYLPGKVIATFALGSKRLYDFMNRNPQVEMHPCDFTNDPYFAGQNDNLIAINASIQVDLFGQCCSESMGSTPYSGTGGQADFVRAANRSKGGKSFIVLPSTAKNGKISRICATLTLGAAVSTSKNEVNYVVTEYGVAQLRGKTARQRALALIAIAHPDFRDELTEAAKTMKLI